MSQRRALPILAREEGTYLELALEVGNIGIFRADLFSRRTQFSPQLQRIIGIEGQGELSYENAIELIHPDDRLKLLESAQNAAGVPDGRWSVVCRSVRPDRSIRWVAIRGRRLYRADGVPEASLGTVIDITALKEAELSLQATNQRYQFALEAAQMGTFEIDFDRDRLSLDPQMARLLDMPAPVGEISVERHAHEGRPALRTFISALRARTSVAGAQTIDIGFDVNASLPRWLRLHADAKDDRIFGVAIDATRERYDAHILREKEARLRVATEAAALGVFEWDPETDTCVWENDRIYEIFGRDRASGPLSLRDTLSGHLHADDRNHFLQRLQRAVRRNGKIHLVGELANSGRSKRWVEVTGRVYQDEGEAKRLVGVVSDISRQKRLRARAQRLTVQVEQVQQTERRNIFQELHDTTIQHLVAASLMVSELRRGDQKTMGSAMEALDSSLAQAIKEVRTLSYLMHPASVSGRNFASAASHYVRGFSGRSGLQCNFRCDRPVTEFSSASLHAAFRVLQESLTNIFRHAGASKASIQVRVVNRNLHVIVTDNGPGIDKHVRRKTSALPPAAGAGLKGMRMRITQVGGRLALTSAPRQGVRVHAVLPPRA
jgi:PAS domain S-box-containing protein